MRMTLLDIRAAMNASGSLEHLSSVTPATPRIDSRKVEEGDIFFCISGERTDGHLYAAQAAGRGAVAVVVEKDPPDWPVQTGCALLYVDDVVKALGRLGNHYRIMSRAMVVGVTGTAGKTTVKETITAILGQAGVAACNAGNLNTQIGMPLSMLEMTGEEDFWVLEAGISRPKDMDELGAILEPDVALVLNVGPAHLEGLGSVAGVARAKTKLLQYLRPSGRGVCNRDYPELEAEAAGYGETVTWFSTQDPTAEFFGEYLGPADDKANGKGKGLYRLRLGKEVLEPVLPGRGSIFAENAIAAAAAATVLGLAPDVIERGLGMAKQVQGRMQHTRIGSWLLVDDAYNANPMSMAGALRSVRELAKGEPLVLVLGEMLELGPGAADAHRGLGVLMAESAPEAVFWVGGHGEAVHRGLCDAGWNGVWQELDGVEACAKAWSALGMSKGIVFFKGSRGNKLEDYVAAITRELQA